ncbi:MAG: small basic protein [Candidatus Kappaea frigidicola]|nr:small basic protein [Candidatus Kappaea frigidicola]
MSQHRSLRGAPKDKKIRSVHNRFERIKELQEKGSWDDKKSVFGLPKVKVERIKVKKGAPKSDEDVKEDIDTTATVEAKEEKKETKK